MTGFGAAALSVGRPHAAPAQPSQTFRLEAKPTAILLHRDAAPTQIWGLESAAAPLRLKAGQFEVTFRNGLPVPALLDWRGIDGASAAEPLTARSAAAPGSEATYTLPLRRAGTFLAELRVPAGPEAQPSRPLPFIVADDTPLAIDRDEIVLIEGWGGGPDKATPAPRADDPSPVFTVNGQILPDIAMRSGERLRLRFINGSQQQVIAVKIEELEVRVIALDSAPSEPFPARNSAIILAPGGRADVLIDAAIPPDGTAQVLLHDGQQARPIARLVASAEAPIRSHPLPPPPALFAPDLPAQLDLKSAMRVDLALQGEVWVAPSDFSASRVPAFEVKRGRTVVLALANHAGQATSFHLHGHHVRLLDRLDDGWKPFWLDTLVVEPGQTERIAFAATYPGRWLIESTATGTAAPGLVRWYSVA